MAGFDRASCQNRDSGRIGYLKRSGLNTLLEERKMRIAISVYGYLKRMAAIQCLQHGKDMISVMEVQALLSMVVRHVHNCIPSAQVGQNSVIA
jgi:hypothetical protein